MGTKVQDCFGGDGKQARYHFQQLPPEALSVHQDNSTQHLLGGQPKMYEDQQSVSSTVIPILSNFSIFFRFTCLHPRKWIGLRAVKTQYQFSKFFFLRDNACA